MNNLKKRDSQRWDFSSFSWVFEIAVVAVVTPALLYGVWSINNLPMA